jgi:large subunit ribosomal protein L10
MPSAIKELMVAELTSRLRTMPNAILVDFTGLTAPQADGLRDRLREQGGGMFVVKNSLAVRALCALDCHEAAQLVTGPTALVYGDDPVLLSKTLRDWGRKEHKLTMRGAIAEGKALDSAAVEALAALPPLEVLRAQVVGAIASPLSAFAGALAGILRNLVGVLKAVADKEPEGG